MQPKNILHVDINSYFATLLQQENPYLRNKPIGVIKDGGRTCIIAASKEAKKFGVATGSRAVEARKLCPKIKLIPASFERYLDATKRLQCIFESISPQVYIYSLDEAFVDVTHCREHLFPVEKFKTLNEIGTHIQQCIFNELGTTVTSNVGIGPNRLLAKLASEIAPKGSVLHINDSNKDSYLASVSFDEVCGIGYRLSKKLALLNVTTPYQIRFFSEEELESYVGPYWAKELLKIAYGEEPELLARIDSPQKPYMQSVGRSITGYRAYHPKKDRSQIISILYNLSLEIIDKVRTMQLAGRHFSISLLGSRNGPQRNIQTTGKWGDQPDQYSQHSPYWSNHITLKAPINHAQELQQHISHLFQDWPADFSVIKFSVRLSLLEPHQQDQLLPSWHKQEKLQTALDEIHKKHGLFTVRPARIQKEHLIRPEVTGFLGDRTYQLRADS
jgi:DNA polymerase IV